MDRAGEIEAPVGTVQTSYSLQLVLMGYFSVDGSLQRYKYLLDIVDHFTKFAVVVPTTDQTVSAAQTQWKNFILLHMAAQCNYTQIRETVLKYESHIQVYHSQGIGACEHLNHTLLQLLRT